MSAYDALANGAPERDDVRRIWERYVRTKVASNDEHLACFYCYDDSSPDLVDVFQLHASREGGKAFIEQAWYPAYEKETAALLAGPSELRTATPQWIKGAGATRSIDPEGRRGPQ